MIYLKKNLFRVLNSENLQDTFLFIATCLIILADSKYSETDSLVKGKFENIFKHDRTKIIHRASLGNPHCDK